MKYYSVIPKMKPCTFCCYVERYGEYHAELVRRHTQNERSNVEYKEIKQQKLNWSKEAYHSKRKAGEG